MVAADSQPIVFDMDGVLVDTDDAWLQVRRDLALAHGGRWDSGAERAMQGVSTAEWTRYMTAEMGVQLTPEEVASRVFASLDRLYRTAPPFLPGTADTIRRLAAAGHPLAVASGSPRSIIVSLLEAGAIADTFDAIVSADEVPHGKPSPDVFLEAARRLGADPAACLAVEDSANGLRAASAAGMEVAAIPNRSEPPGPDALALADHVAATVPELFAQTVA